MEQSSTQTVDASTYRGSRELAQECAHCQAVMETCRAALEMMHASGVGCTCAYEAALTLVRECPR